MYPLALHNKVYKERIRLLRSVLLYYHTQHTHTHTCTHTHVYTHTHTRARAHTHTHTHRQSPASTTFEPSLQWFEYNKLALTLKQKQPTKWIRTHTQILNTHTKILQLQKTFMFQLIKEFNVMGSFEISSTPHSMSISTTFLFVLCLKTFLFHFPLAKHWSENWHQSNNNGCLRSKSSPASLLYYHYLNYCPFHHHGLI
jgi:hypothetical protein